MTVFWGLFINFVPCNVRMKINHVRIFDKKTTRSNRQA